MILDFRPRSFKYEFQSLSMWQSPSKSASTSMPTIIAVSHALNYELNAKSLADRLGVISSLPD